MRTLHALRPLALACALLLGEATALAAVPAATALDAAYTVDLRAFLDKIGAYRIMLAGAEKNADPAQREYFDAFAASMTPDRFYAVMLPIAARHITPEHARTLGAMARGQTVSRDRQTAALQAIANMNKDASQEFKAAGYQLGMDFSKQLQARFVAELRRCAAELAEHRGTGYLVKPNKLGVPTMDRVAVLVVKALGQQLDSAHAVGLACEGTFAGEQYKITDLLTDAGVSMARQGLARCEQALETSGKESEATVDEVRAGMLALSVPGQAAFAERVNTDIRETYEYLIKEGEVGRQLLVMQRRIIDLVEARRAHIQIHGDRLAFESDEDLAQFNQIIEEMTTAGKALNDMIYARRQKGVLRNIDLHDGITAPEQQAPAL
jgi:hypothetical protein